jgi:hypothetical protein
MCDPKHKFQVFAKEKESTEGFIQQLIADIQKSNLLNEELVKSKESMIECNQILKEEKEQLKKEKQSLNSVVNELKKEIHQLKKRNIKLNEKLKNNKRANQLLESKNKILQSLIGDHDQLIQNLERENDHLNEQLNTIESKSPNQFQTFEAKIHQLEQEKINGSLSPSLELPEIWSVNDEYIQLIEQEKEKLMEEVESLNKKHKIFHENIFKELIRLNKRAAQEEENQKLQDQSISELKIENDQLKEEIQKSKSTMVDKSPEKENNITQGKMQIVKNNAQSIGEKTILQLENENKELKEEIENFIKYSKQLEAENKQLKEQNVILNDSGSNQAKFLNSTIEQLKLKQKQSKKEKNELLQDKHQLEKEKKKLN